MLFMLYKIHRFTVINHCHWLLDLYFCTETPYAIEQLYCDKVALLGYHDKEGLVLFG